MSTRPDLSDHLDRQTFLSFYYLKEELISFCKANGLSTAGGKADITERIAHYLETGQILIPAQKKKAAKPPLSITESTKIEPDFVCSESHRAFFKNKIGKSFSFNVAFQNWLKNNTGKTYAQAIEAYYKILEDKKKNRTVIDKQFEYNTYIRDFYADNKGRSLDEAIRCWKHKKSLPGHNRYEKKDLNALL